MITSTCAYLLQLRREATVTTIRTVGNAKAVPPRARVLFHLHHRGDPPLLPVTAEVMDCISAAMPSSRLRRWDYFEDCDLADPVYHLSKPVEVLLGADVLPFILRSGLTLPLHGAPAAFETSLGWVLYGPYTFSKSGTKARFEPNASGALPSEHPQRQPLSPRHRRSRGNSPTRSSVNQSATTQDSSNSSDSYMVKLPAPSTALRSTLAVSNTHPKILIVRLYRTGSALGLAIVAKKGAGQGSLGIYVRTVMSGGAAARDGRIASGDQILSVDGHSLRGLTQEEAIKLLIRPGSFITLQVYKGDVMLPEQVIIHSPSVVKKSPDSSALRPRHAVPGPSDSPPAVSSKPNRDSSIFRSFSATPSSTQIAASPVRSIISPATAPSSTISFRPSAPMRSCFSAAEVMPSTPVTLPQPTSTYLESGQVRVDPLVEIVRRFWELEQVPDRLPYTPDEQKCEIIYANTVCRSSSGRYEVALPFSSDTTLGVSVNVATRQFLRLEQRLARQPALQAAYAAFMKDYLDSGHMELVTTAAEPSIREPYYIPHHPVHRPDDPPTKLRVVFNASCASSNGKSLNDLLLTGPKLQADIDTLLLRFRLPSIVFTCDIRQMYRQILIRPDHRDYQRIVWRFSSAEPPQSYRLNTVTYGVSTAPFLALRTLLQLAQDESATHPQAAKVLANDVYVDDVLTGAETADQALALRHDIQGLLMAGGFELRKWATNYPPLLQGIPADHCRSASSGSTSPQLLLDRDPVIKILGLRWNPVSDSFFYSVRLGTPSTTKRTILSQMARIFDPLGWLTPVSFQTKLFFRHLCQLGVDWDQSLPPSFLAIWDEFQAQLPSLSELSIPRLLPAANDRSIHHLVGFCDASESGYAAVVYMHTTSVDGVTTSTVLAAKSKVAPLKKVTLPRLELCGAHLLARLMHVIATRMLPQWHLPLIAFCDSTVTLAWINGNCHRWQTFVGNRVAAIQDYVPPSSWFHVTSEDNPADCASRGVTPKCLLTHPLWWHGPAWLTTPKSSWPRSFAKLQYSSDEVIAEEKPPARIVLHNAATEPGLESRFSSLSRMQRVLAYCRRFAYNVRHPNDKREGFFHSAELWESLVSVVRHVQHLEFPTERLEAANPSSRHRTVRQLHLFLDDQDILRVGGRLSASSLTYHQKHPILLPKRHHLTSLVIDDAHLRLLHAGALATHAHIRQRFWIPDGRNVVRFRLRHCNRCFTCKPRPIIQPMGNLPKERLNAAGAFVTTGVDYAGPFLLSSARLRGTAVTKAYLVVFICFATKAVHLEVASNLTSGAFIAAYRRFAARRGHSSVIFSDNGTNFVGANTELRDLGRLLLSPDHRTLVTDVATSAGTDWRFIPPSSPHFGGLWESVVKSAKHHLKRVIGEQRLTYEEFLTVCSQIEAILNSRPLMAPSSDPTDLEVLTPGHFLIGRPLTTLPDPNLTSVALNRLSRWQLVQRIQQDLWKRWQHEYLHTLQQRSKWLTPSSDVRPGIVVLIKEDNLPPLRWSIGRISSVFPGPDGVVRVAEVFTSSGTLRRPIAKLCPLPTQ